MKKEAIMSSREITGSIQRKKLKGGNYLYMVLNLYDEDGKFRQKWVSTGLTEVGNKKKAEAILGRTLVELNDRRNELERERKMAETNPLVVDCLIDYLKKVKNNIEGNTFQAYLHRCKKIETYFQGKRVQDITPREVNQFCQYLLEKGKVNQKTGEREPLSQATVKDIKLNLGQVLDEAKTNGFIKENPVREVRLSGTHKKKQGRKFLAMEKEEIEEVFRRMESLEDPLTDIVKVMFYYGLRRSEAMAIRLDKDSLDMEERVLHIRSAYVNLEKDGAQLRDSTKSEDGMRNFSISENMYGFFQSVIRKREENKEFFGNTYQDSGFLFTWPDGVAFRHDYISSHFEKFMMKQYGRKFTIHNLRHSCATFLFREGVDEGEIGSWLGHADPGTSRKWYVDYKRYANDMTDSKISHKVKIMA